MVGVENGSLCGIKCATLRKTGLYWSCMSDVGGEIGVCARLLPLLV